MRIALIAALLLVAAPAFADTAAERAAAAAAARAAAQTEAGYPDGNTADVHTEARTAAGGR